MRSGWRECILSLEECEEKENQSWTISAVANKVAAFPQNRQKMFTDATNLATMTFSDRLNVCHTFVTDTWQQTLSCRHLHECNFLPDNLSYQCSRQQTFSVSPFSSRFSFYVTTLPVTNVKHGCFQTVWYGSFLPDNRISVMLSGAVL